MQPDISEPSERVTRLRVVVAVMNGVESSLVALLAALVLSMPMWHLYAGHHWRAVSGRVTRVDASFLVYKGSTHIVDANDSTVIAVVGFKDFSGQYSIATPVELPYRDHVGSRVTVTAYSDGTRSFPNMHNWHTNLATYWSVRLALLMGLICGMLVGRLSYYLHDGPGAMHYRITLLPSR